MCRPSPIHKPTPAPLWMLGATVCCLLLTAGCEGEESRIVYDTERVLTETFVEQLELYEDLFVMGGSACHFYAIAGWLRG